MYIYKRLFFTIIISLQATFLFSQDRVSISQPIPNPTIEVNELDAVSSSKYQNRILFAWNKWYKQSLLTLVDENLSVIWSYQFPDSICISNVKSDNNGSFWYGGYQTLNNNQIGVFGKIDLNGQIIFHKIIDPLFNGMIDIVTEINWIHALSNGEVYLGTVAGNIYRLDNLGNVIWSNTYYQEYINEFDYPVYSANSSEDIVLCLEWAEPFGPSGILILRINSSGQITQQDFYYASSNILNPSNILLMDDGSIYLTGFSNENYIYHYNNLGAWVNGYKLENQNFGISTVNAKLFSLSNGNFLYKLRSYHTNIVLDPTFSILTQQSHNESTFDFGEVYSTDSMVQGVKTHNADMGGWPPTMYKYKIDQQFACGGSDYQYTFSTATNPFNQTTFNATQTSSFVPLNSAITLTAVSISTNTVCALGEDEIELSKFSIYPNPAANIINLKFNDVNEFDSFKIFNLKGEIVQEGVLLESTEIALNVNLANGLYFIKVQGSANQTASYRFIIQK